MNGSNFLRDAIARLKGVKYKNLSELAQKAQVSQGNLSSFMREEGARNRRETMTLDSAWKILGVLGLQPSAPGEVQAPKEAKKTAVAVPAVPAVTTRDVCFVDAKVVPAGEGIKPPLAEDYIAAPMVGEVGAGRGYIAQEDVESWFLIYRRALPDNHSGDLFAVQIGKHSRSMQPTLYPGDIVLVDKGARIDEAFGRLMLVRDEDGESGMIKRVELTPRPGDTLITYYSDNAAEYPPVTYSLNEHFGGELKNAIVGRVIWAWSNVRNK